MSLIKANASVTAEDTDGEAYVQRGDGAQEAMRRPEVPPASQATQCSHVRA